MLVPHFPTNDTTLSPSTKDLHDPVLRDVFCFSFLPGKPGFPCNECDVRVPDLNALLAHKRANHVKEGSNDSGKFSRGMLTEEEG